MAFVTGGSRGIGAAVVRRLVGEGADVTFSYASSAQAANALVAELAGAGGRVTAVQVDSADAVALGAAIGETAGHAGRLDVLVNNAGVLERGSVETLGMDAFDRVFAVNVRAVYAGVQAAQRHMGEGASIITVGSIVADRSGFPGASVYSASKGAVQAMTRGFARDLGPRGITVNNVQPGPTETDMNAPEYHDMLSSLIALGRIGKPGEVAAFVAWLAGPDARFITGASLTIDGGYLA
ncbi:SDR family oxidoreductase [Luteibacter aegosomatissinici]|uniref:SDR family oxidoreductase n=1 Tax=Luteibacter aegosomatissinici TaxID=2911539 RepID=UPI001FF70A3D|nr:SDR family oxidoreductase [Luteibacter aegosomatissinici]UPG96327.1 SDR family oxidoreductase [Luteibacter aegosomatissinici]